jgi:hypothetical protein
VTKILAMTLDQAPLRIPKGKRAIWDRERCMFADGRPPQIMAHLRQNLAVAAHRPDSFRTIR